MSNNSHITNDAGAIDSIVTLASTDNMSNKTLTSPALITPTCDGNKLQSLFTVSVRLPGAEAATAANYGIFFIAPFACQITGISEVHTGAGTDSGAVTLDVEKLTGTQAPDAGVACLGATKIDLKGAVNTVQSPALTATTANLQLAAGDRLCLKDTGTLTAVAGVCVTVTLKAI